MLVVMQSHATPVQIDRVLEAILEMGLTPHAMPGPTRTAIGITGNTGTIDSRNLEVLPGVLELIRVTKPYKLASREMHQHDTVISLRKGGKGIARSRRHSIARNKNTRLETVPPARSTPTSHQPRAGLSTR
ncbi:MAG: hypothetical protein ABSH35_07360 [Isosphaeraceae bacterium]|jgi:3-deoxy-7-phosphoheptulonate synthase